MRELRAPDVISRGDDRFPDGLANRKFLLDTSGEPG
jgi:hypothetical protein